MSLTIKDLQKIELLITTLLDEKIPLYLHDIKQDIIKLKDGQAQIRRELDTEHEVRRQHIEDNTRRITVLEKTILQ